MGFPKIEGAYARVEINNEGNEDCGKMNIIFPDGHWLLDRWVDEIHPDEANGKTLFHVRERGKESIVGIDGNAIAGGFNWVFEFHSGIALIERNHRYNYLRADGTFLLSNDVKRADGFRQGEYAVYWDDENEKHMIDVNGKEIAK